MKFKKNGVLIKCHEILVITFSRHYYLVGLAHMRAKMNKCVNCFDGKKIIVRLLIDFVYVERLV